MKSHSASFDVVAIFLILGEPFFEHIYTNRFVLEFANLVILIGVAAISLALAWLLQRFPSRGVYAVIVTAVITLFLDVRANMIDALGLQALLVVAACFLAAWFLHANASKILIVVFGVISVFIVTLPVHPQIQEFAAARQSSSARQSELPTYVHIVLDEFVGTEALDEENADQRALKRSVQDLFIGNGFRLFGRTYSEYFDTTDSLTALFNAYSGPRPTQFYDFSNEAFNKVTQNAYLRALFDAGYTIRTYQTPFLDFCAGAPGLVHSCLTYNPFWGASSAALQELTWREKLTVTLATLWRRSTIIKGVRRLLQRAAALTAGTDDPPRPRELDDIFLLGAIPTLPVFDQLISDVAAAPAGTMFFAHLMIPHHPYSVDQSCQIRRPLLDWKLNAFPVARDSGEANDDVSRTARYADYAEQSRCTLVKLQELFDALKSAGKFDGATIIIHADHGSKISRFRLRKALRDKLSDRDYYDGFSTLFAVKTPHIAPGYDLRMLSIERVLQHAIATGSASPAEPENHFVYLRDEEPSSSFIKVPMPEIPIGTIRPPRGGAE